MLTDRYCSWCGMFIPRGEWSVKTGGLRAITRIFCSYRCFNKHQDTKEHVRA